MKSINRWVLAIASSVVLAGCGATTPTRSTYVAPADPEIVVATQANDVAKVKQLVDMQVDIDETGVYKNALSSAASRGHVEIVEILIAAGADLDKKDKSGLTAVQNAAFVGFPDIVVLLLDAGAQLNTRSDHGLYGLPLHLAARRQGDSATEVAELRSAEILLERGENANALDIDGRTALHISARSSDIAMSELLLANGADPNVIDLAGGTALDYAEYAGNTEMIALLTDAQASNGRLQLIGMERCPEHWGVLYKNMSVADFEDATSLDLSSIADQGFAAQFFGAGEFSTRISDNLTVDIGPEVDNQRRIKGVHCN